jgi:uncharacterized protein
MSDDAVTPPPEVPQAPEAWPPPPSPGGYAAPPPGYAPPPPGYPPPPPPPYGGPAGTGIQPYDPNGPVRPSGPNDTVWALLAHLSYFVLAIIAPLIIMLTVGKTSPFVRRHSTEALNFHLSLLIYAVVSLVLIIVVIGIFLLLAVAVFGVVMTIIAAIKAAQGEDYHYPLTIRLVK